MKATVKGVDGTVLKTYIESGTDVGTYNLTINVNDIGSNYTLDGVEITKSMTIVPATATIEWFGEAGKTVTYDGKDHNIIARAYGVGGVLVETFTGTHKDVGTYSLTVSMLANSNYTLKGIDASVLTQTLTIVAAAAE